MQCSRLDVDVYLKRTTYTCIHIHLQLYIHMHTASMRKRNDGALDGSMQEPRFGSNHALAGREGREGMRARQPESCNW